MSGRPKKKRADPDYWIPACVDYSCVQGQWASDEEIGRGLKDLGRFLAEVEAEGANGRAGSAVSYLAHRIARAHLVREGSSIYDVRDHLDHETGDAQAVFLASWPWRFDGAEPVGRAVLESPAWRQTEPWFIPTSGPPF